MTDNGAKALAERLEATRVDGDLFARGSRATADAILADGAVFLTAEEAERLRRIEAADGLGQAWAEAEAALPEGHSVGVTKTVKVASGPYVATTDFGPAEHAYAYGPTPAAALLTLAAALTEPSHD